MYTYPHLGSCSALAECATRGLAFSPGFCAAADGAESVEAFRSRGGAAEVADEAVSVDCRRMGAFVSVLDEVRRDDADETDDSPGSVAADARRASWGAALLLLRANAGGSEGLGAAPSVCVTLLLSARPSAAEGRLDSGGRDDGVVLLEVVVGFTC